MRKTLATLILANLTIGIGVTQTVVVDSRMHGYAYNSPYNRLYNLRSQITFDGRITGIQRVEPRNGMSEGVTILVKAPNGGTAVVELGPTWFVDNQKTKLNLKDQVQVTGSKIMVDGRGVILAKLVKVGHNVLALRRPEGYPYWDIAQPVTQLPPDPNVIEITGAVDRMTTFGTGPNIASGLVLRTANGLVNIDLGPTWFYEPQAIMFNPGARLTILTGGTYSVSPTGRIVPAYWIRSGDNIYQIRTSSGRGVWENGPTP